MLSICQEIIHQYILVNKIELKQFKDNIVGLMWIENFMKRNKLSHKKAEMINTVRKASTSNTFMVYDFYNLIDEV